MQINGILLNDEWVDAIDGRRTVIDIVKKTLPNASEKPPLENARVFFERLWLYDQVVFEMKGATDYDSSFAVVE